MTEITFVAPDGRRTTTHAENGDSIMRVATSNAIDGVIAECGGALACATCHVHVDPDWIDQTGSAEQNEADMLEFAMSEADKYSRLSCQIIVSPALDGLVVHLPKEQG